jgi:hypothetical protein
MSIILNSLCFVLHNFDKAQAFRAILNTNVGVDLMIVDILKGLLISMVSRHICPRVEQARRWLPVDDLLILQAHWFITIGCFYSSIQTIFR